MSKSKEIKNRKRHDFLLTFFKEPHKHEWEQVNGYWLECRKGLSGWEVGIYDQDSYKKVQSYLSGLADPTAQPLPDTG